MAQNDRIHNYWLWIVRATREVTTNIYRTCNSSQASGTDHQTPENQELNMNILTIFSFELFLMEQNAFINGL